MAPESMPVMISMFETAKAAGLSLKLHFPSDCLLHDTPAPGEVFAYIERAPGAKWRVSSSFDVGKPV
jgi:hypothetical protein